MRFINFLYGFFPFLQFFYSGVVCGVSCQLPAEAGSVQTQSLPGPTHSTHRSASRKTGSEEKIKLLHSSIFVTKTTEKMNQQKHLATTIAGFKPVFLDTEKFFCKVLKIARILSKKALMSHTFQPRTQSDDQLWYLILRENKKIKTPQCNVPPHFLNFVSCCGTVKINTKESIKSAVHSKKNF